jgi:hypothetical protein
MSLSALAAVGLLQAGAPYCPPGHSRAECDAVWASSQAVAASQGRSTDRQVSAGATAYMAAGDVEPPTILPVQVRMRLAYQTTDLLAQMAGTSVVLKKATYFVDAGGLICGTALFGDRLQTFYSNTQGLTRGATARQMEAAGCSQGGGVQLANY